MTKHEAFDKNGKKILYAIYKDDKVEEDRSIFSSNLNHGELHPGLVVKHNNGQWYVILKIVNTDIGTILKVVDEDMGHRPILIDDIKWPIGSLEYDYIGLGDTRFKADVIPFIKRVEKTFKVNFPHLKAYIDEEGSKWWVRYMGSSHVAVAPNAMAISGPPWLSAQFILNINQLDPFVKEEIRSWVMGVKK